MSAALETMTAEETALLKQMEADDAANPMPPRQSDPAPEPVVTPEPVAKEPDPKVVDKRALDEERGRRKKAEAHAQELARNHAAELAKVQTRLDMLAEAAQAHVNSNTPPPVETQSPAFDVDPRGYIEHNLKTLAQKQAEIDKRLAEIATGTTRLTEQTQRDRELADLQSWGNATEREFIAQTPDYQAAMAHLVQSREAQLRAIGLDDPQQIAIAIQHDVIGTAQAARQRGKGLGEVLYSLAKASGYAPGAAAGASARSPTVAAPVAADSAAERLIRGQDMATTVGSTGGAPNGEVAVSAIANMSDEAFAKMYEAVRKKGGASMRNLFGE